MLNINGKPLDADKFISNSVRDELNSLFHNNIKKQLASYLLYKIASKSSLNKIKYEDILKNKLNLEDDILFSIENHISREDLEKIIEIGKRNNDIDLFAYSAAFSKDSNDESSDGIPDTLKVLISKILNVKETERVLDLCCGRGYMLEALENRVKAQYVGVSINPDDIVSAKITKELIGDSCIEYVQANVFSSFNNKKDTLFDKIVGNYPLGQSLRFHEGAKQYINRKLTTTNSFSKLTSTDWIYNSLICDLLSEKGKAVAIMASGGTWNTSDKEMRKYFIENGLIESIIALPTKLFKNTKIATSLIVFSKGNNSTTFLDATNLYLPTWNEDCGISQDDYLDCCPWEEQETKKELQLEEAGGDSKLYKREIPISIIDDIIKRLKEDSKISRIVSKQEIQSNDYNLNPIYYLDNKITFKNGVPFKSLIKNITRGVSCTSSEIEKITSSQETPYKYLMISNISNGLIDTDLTSLTEISSKQEKYCLKDSDLIISKSGRPYKIAVAEIDANSKVLVNGNLYIITLDRTKVNPFYIKTFLDSSKGQYLLKRASVGSVIPTLSVEGLEKIQIPLPPLEKQDQIANLFLAAKDEYLINKKRLEKSINKLSTVFDDNGEVE